MKKRLLKKMRQIIYENNDKGIFSMNTMHERIRKGDIYEHYKGNLYKIIDLSCHSEDLSWYVVYETLYHNEVSAIWHRPLEMFLGTLEIDGKEVRRFKKVE
jgi:hypothetical protein